MSPQEVVKALVIMMFGCSYQCFHFITLHAQREQGKVIGVGVHIRECGSTLCVPLCRIDGEVLDANTKV